MIGKFFPFIVTAAVQAAASNPINVRSTSAATEIANDVEWLLNGG